MTNFKTYQDISSMLLSTELSNNIIGFHMLIHNLSLDERMDYALELMTYAVDGNQSHLRTTRKNKALIQSAYEGVMYLEDDQIDSICRMLRRRNTKMLYIGNDFHPVFYALLRTKEKCTLNTNIHLGLGVNANFKMVSVQSNEMNIEVYEINTIEKLQLGDATNKIDERIYNLTNLKSVVLNGVGVDKDIITLLSKHPTLESLTLVNCKLTQIPDISGCKLKSINFSGGVITPNVKLSRFDGNTPCKILFHDIKMNPVINDANFIKEDYCQRYERRLS